ncbi:MAG: hypothetical protein ABIY55_13405 [Kofleriaceae bacterium]
MALVTWRITTLRGRGASAEQGCQPPAGDSANGLAIAAALGDARRVTASVLVLIGAAVLHVALFTGTTWWLLRALGGHATEAAFGMPALIKRRVGTTTVSIGPIPTGSVTILGRMGDEPASDPRDWRHLKLGKRLAILCVPWLLVIAIAMGCLGPRHAASSFAHGVTQLLLVLDLTPLVRRFFALAAVNPVSVTLGLLFAKSVALNLLPVPGLAGGGLILELVPGRRPGWMLAGSLVMLWVTVRLVYALIRLLIT